MTYTIQFSVPIEYEDHLQSYGIKSAKIFLPGGLWVSGNAFLGTFYSFSGLHFFHIFKSNIVQLGGFVRLLITQVSEIEGEVGTKIGA